MSEVTKVETDVDPEANIKDLDSPDEEIKNAVVSCGDQVPPKDNENDRIKETPAEDSKNQVVAIDESAVDDEKPIAAVINESDELNPPTLDPTEDDDDKWNDNYQFVEDDKPGIDPDEKDPQKLILWAAQNNELDTLRDLLEKDSSLVNARDNDLYTPLHRAAYNNNVDAIKILLTYDADVSAKTVDGWQPLHSACKWDSVEAASLLIQNGADVNAQTNGHVTPLHLAAANSAGRRTLELLLWHPHIDPNIKNDADDTPYDIASRSGPLVSLFEMLEESINVY